MFDEIPTHALNDNAVALVIPLGADPAYCTSIFNAAADCALQAWKPSQLSSGVPHE